MYEENRQTIVSDLYLVAYLSLHSIKHEKKIDNSRVSFVFTDPAADSLIQDFYRSEINQYVEQLKRIKTEMYQFKEDNS